MVGAIILAVLPLAISTVLVLNRRRIVERQRTAALKKGGKLGPFFADRMGTTQVVIAAVAILVLGTLNLIGYITTYGV